MLEIGQTVKGLDAEYRVDAKLAERTGVAFAGTRTKDESRVVLKALRIDGAKDRSAVERFEREAAVLRSVSHACIPKLHEIFAWDGKRASAVREPADKDGARTLVLVEERLDGESLATKAKRGDRFTGGRADTMLRGMLRLLRYLHERRPPVIHGDINPSNVLIARDDTPSLVDFSGVEDRGANAEPRTDLHALGMTMLAALSGTERRDMPVDAATSKPKVDEIVPSLSPRIRKVLAALVEPIASKRPANALEALALLDATPPTVLRRIVAATLGLGAAALLVTMALRMKRPADAPPSRVALPMPRVATRTPTDETPTIVSGMSYAWGAHVKTADGVHLAKDAACTVRADVRLVRLRTGATPQTRVARFTVRCGDETVHEQRAEEIAPDVADEEPGDAPGTYRLALTMYGADGETRYDWNALQQSLVLRRSGERAVEIRLFVDELSAEQTTPLYEASSSKWPESGTLVPRRTLRGRVEATTGTPPWSAKTGARCEVVARPTFPFEREKRAVDCDVSVFCGDEYVFAAESACKTADPLELEIVSLRGVGDQRHELRVDAAAKSARFSERSVPYTLSIRLE